MAIYPGTVSDRTEPPEEPERAPVEWMDLCAHCHACERAYVLLVDGSVRAGWRDDMASALGCGECEQWEDQPRDLRASRLRAPGAPNAPDWTDYERTPKVAPTTACMGLTGRHRGIGEVMRVDDIGMTATDELRRMLDERDEYYRTSGNKTWWGRPIDRQTGKPINVYHYQAQPMGEDRLVVELQLATPEQAIAATLGDSDATATRQGVGTCKPHGEWERVSQTQEVRRLVCDCGEELGMEERGTLPWRYNHRASLPNYCPNCGRKVVTNG